MGHTFKVELIGLVNGTGENRRESERVRKKLKMTFNVLNCMIAEMVTFFHPSNKQII